MTFNKKKFIAWQRIKYKKRFKHSQFIEHAAIERFLADSLDEAITKSYEWGYSTARDRYKTIEELSK